MHDTLYFSLPNLAKKTCLATTGRKEGGEGVNKLTYQI